MLKNSFERIIDDIKKFRIFNIKHKYSFNIFKSLNCCIWRIKLNKLRKRIKHLPNDNVFCENVDFEKIWNEIKVDDKCIAINQGTSIDTKCIGLNNKNNTFYNNIESISRGNKDFPQLTLRKNRS